MLKHTEENIEKQQELGMKQGVKSAMAWRVSKMKPRSPNGGYFVFFYYLSSSFMLNNSFSVNIL